MPSASSSSTRSSRPVSSRARTRASSTRSSRRPPGSTLEYTNAKSQELEEIAKELEEVTSVTSLAGYEVLTEGRGSNAGTCIINLKNWSERKRTARQIIEELEEKCREMTNVKLEFFEPPAVPGFGAAGGFSMRVLDKTQSSTADYKRLGEVTDKFMAALKQTQGGEEPVHLLCRRLPAVRAGHQQRRGHAEGRVDRQGAGQPQHLIGSTWEQGFILFNQFYKVYVQASPEFRRYPRGSGQHVRQERQGGNGSLLRVHDDQEEAGLERDHPLQPVSLRRHSRRAGSRLQQRSGHPGDPGGRRTRRCRAVTAIGWEGISYDESKKGNEAIYIFLIVVAFVYLVLVGQYESFILPLAVILSLPVGVFGSFFFLQAMGLANDVYAQIGLVMLVGLLGKNAILIVEFAVQRRREGVTLKEAAIEGGKLRFRPIQMTSFAFIAGLIPLVVATGAGAIGNRTIGTTGVGGMLVGTVIGVLVIPGLYYLFGRIADGRKLLQDEVG